GDDPCPGAPTPLAVDRPHQLRRPDPVRGGGRPPASPPPGLGRGALRAARALHGALSLPVPLDGRDLAALQPQRLLLGPLAVGGRPPVAELPGHLGRREHPPGGDQHGDHHRRLHGGHDPDHLDERLRPDPLRLPRAEVCDGRAADDLSGPRRDADHPDLLREPVAEPDRRLEERGRGDPGHDRRRPGLQHLPADQPLPDVTRRALRRGGGRRRELLRRLPADRLPADPPGPGDDLAADLHGRLERLPRAAGLPLAGAGLSDPDDRPDPVLEAVPDPLPRDGGRRGRDAGPGRPRLRLPPALLHPRPDRGRDEGV
ncbi:MAG: ABC transporter, permease protein 2 (cluster 1, maltose/g3p/polyamine/iron), partial [uncultured Thermomicrobiales bacterium]